MAKKVFKYLMALAAVLTATACNGKATPNPSQGGNQEAVSESELPLSPERVGEKLLVVFFSHAGDNYAVGNIEMGNTKIVADYISEFTGADQFEIKTAKYDVIFIGGPVWWGTYPQVMFTFFKQYDLSGKTIIPFTTHEGSGLGSCVNDVKKTYPKANVTEGFSIYGHDVRTGKDRVEKWLKKLGAAIVQKKSPANH